jgi:hypothetical protein
MNSVSVRAGTAGLTTTTFGIVATTASGVKSLIGS